MRQPTIDEIFERTCRPTFTRVLEDLARDWPDCTAAELGELLKQYMARHLRPAMSARGVGPEAWPAIDRLVDRIVAERTGAN